MVRAFLRGLEDTLADPDAAFEIARRAIPEMDDETAVLQRAVLDESIEFWRSERAGATDPRAWEASVTLLNEMGLLARGASEITRTAFSPKSNNLGPSTQAQVGGRPVLVCAVCR